MIYLQKYLTWIEDSNFVRLKNKIGDELVSLQFKLQFRCRIQFVKLKTKRDISKCPFFIFFYLTHLIHYYFLQAHSEFSQVLEYTFKKSQDLIGFQVLAFSFSKF